MSQLLLSTIQTSSGVSLAVTEFETVFDSSVKTTEQTALFNTKGATNIVVMQTATNTPPTARVIESETNWSGAATAIDDNLNNETCTDIGTSVSGTGTMVVDFQSIATRNISTKARASLSCDSSGQSSNTASVSVEYSTDNISYSGGGGIVSVAGSSSGSPNVTSTRTDNGVNMRYARITGVHNDATVNCSSYNACCFECFDDAGLGTSTIQFELLDDERSEWRVIIPTSVFPTQDANTGSNNLTMVGHNMTERYALPFTTTNLRIKMNVTNGVDTSVVVAKVFE